MAVVLSMVVPRTIADFDLFCSCDP
jgi:hypothetical protein